MEHDRTLRQARETSSSLGHLAWLPVPLVALAAAVLYGLRISTVYESAVLLATLSTLFRTSASLLVAYLSARTYHVAGSRSALALGCGAVAFGVASLWVCLLLADETVALTIHNSGLLLAGACFLLSSACAVRGKRRAPVPSALAVTGLCYTGVVVALGLVYWGHLAGVLPDFYVPGRGFTPLRQAVLSLALLEFACASLCFFILYGRSRTPFLKWCSIGLALIGMGVLVITVEGAPGTLLSWVGRSGQFLGGLYLLIGITTVAEGPWGWQIPLEQALRESEDRYRALVETSPEPIVVHRSGRFLYANLAALRLYGADSLAQLSRYAVVELIAEEERAEAASRIEQVAAGSTLPMLERRLLRLDGQRVLAEVVAAPVTYQGQPAVQAIIRDVTERKQVEAERERLLQSEHLARQEAEGALRLRDEFLSVAAHELRTPITSLRGYPQLLLRRIDKGVMADAQEVRPALQVMDREAARLADLVSQLLDISRLERGGLALDRQLCDLAGLAREVVESLQASTARQPLILQAPRSLMGSVDALRLRQVLVNLVDNAVKFAPDSSPVEIELATPEPDTLCLSVRDHGPGIPPEERERLFSRYHRAGTRRPAGGLGLGLYISRQIVEAHGGEIRAEFPAGGGTRFVVTLPLAQPERPE